VTRRLLAVGARVVAVEPDPSLASYLRETMAGEDLTIVGTTFEEAAIDCAALISRWLRLHSTGWIKKSV